MNAFKKKSTEDRSSRRQKRKVQTAIITHTNHEMIGYILPECILTDRKRKEMRKEFKCFELKSFGDLNILVSIYLTNLTYSYNADE